MQITPAHIRAGTIVLSESVPTIAIGRTVIATVLAAPKGGSVLVSMFGKKLLVETAIPLEKGQVLNLKVHAVTPKIVLKPMQTEAPSLTSSMKDLGSLLSGIIGRPGEKPLESFKVQEIIRQLVESPAQDAPTAAFVSSLMDQIQQFPQALAYLFIPLVDDGNGNSAQVSVEKDDEAYVLNFDMETENLGSLACRARVEKGRGVDVEIRTPSEDTADFLREHVFELKQALEPFGLRSVEILQARVRTALTREVDVLV